MLIPCLLTKYLTLFPPSLFFSLHVLSLHLFHLISPCSHVDPCPYAPSSWGIAPKDVVTASPQATHLDPRQSKIYHSWNSAFSPFITSPRCLTCCPQSPLPHHPPLYHGLQSVAIRIWSPPSPPFPTAEFLLFHSRVRFQSTDDHPLVQLRGLQPAGRSGQAQVKLAEPR